MSRLRHVLLAVTFILAVTVVALRLLSAGPFSPANGTLLLDSPGCFPKVVSGLPWVWWRLPRFGSDLAAYP
jgi:hypothetical protein